MSFLTIQIQVYKFWLCQIQHIPFPIILRHISNPTPREQPVTNIFMIFSIFQNVS